MNAHPSQTAALASVSQNVVADGPRTSFVRRTRSACGSPSIVDSTAPVQATASVIPTALPSGVVSSRSGRDEGEDRA